MRWKPWCLLILFCALGLKYICTYAISMLIHFVALL
uniref:Uncharacterized protein n=1 Tax=Arundo donax TaxID=35708 RepID=A0A0A8ZEP2_ARUDO